jgi:hypothetical protein
MTSRVSSLLACAGLLASVLSVSERTQAAGSGTVEKITVHGRALEGNLEGDSADRDVMVYLPSSYQTEPNRRFPVVYRRPEVLARWMANAPLKMLDQYILNLWCLKANESVRVLFEAAVIRVMPELKLGPTYDRSVVPRP